MAKTKTSPTAEAPPYSNIGIAGERLRSFVERAERLHEKRAAINADIREVFAEAKGEGFDAKIMRKLIRLRAMDPQQRREEDELLDLYEAALGV